MVKSQLKWKCSSPRGIQYSCDQVYLFPFEIDSNMLCHHANFEVEFDFLAPLFSPKKIYIETKKSLAKRNENRIPKRLILNAIILMMPH